MRNKTDDSRTADVKSNFPKKRNWCSKTDTVNIKRCKSTSSKKRSATKSSSFATDESSSSSKTKKSIGRFFYESGLDFDAVNLPTFHGMISHFSEQANHQIQIPTCQELKGWIFEDAMKDMREYLDDIKNSWAETGCTILLDGWTDEKGRDLINILVECPKGTIYLRSSDISDCIGNMDSMLLFFDRVIKEVGINNVVQIMTSSTSAFMKEVGKQLMEKYRSIFMTVSASCCVELMLEKLKGINLIKETLDKMKIITRFIYSHPIALKLLQDQMDGRDLVEPSKTSSTQPFSILENIVVQKGKLKKFFLPSDDSNSSVLISKTEGKQVADLIADRSFWSGASTTLQAAIPLVKAIEWMDRKNEEQIGYIYETIDQVKVAIKEGFNSRETQYMKFWEVIDKVWTEVLYSPLHAAGYFFNPNLFYSSDVYIDSEVTTGVLCCVVRATRDSHVQDRISVQMEKYQTAMGAFGLGCGGDQSFVVSPVHWWSQYGTECPELQRLALRILGQPCDGASKFRLKRSLAETLLTKGRSRVKQNRLTDMVFLRYNMHLKNFASGKIDDIITSDEIDLMDDWMADRAKHDVSENDETTWMELDGRTTTEQGVTSWFRPKVEKGDLDKPFSFCPKKKKGVIDLGGPSFLDPKLEKV